MKYVLIGGGPASVAAAATLRQEDMSSEVTILCRERFKPYSKMVLPYLLAGDVQEEDLYLSEPDGVDIRLNQEVVRVDPDAHEVITSSDEHYAYDKLLIATGGDAKRLKIEGADLPFVYTIRDIPDVDGIRKQLKGKNGRVAIAGAGPVGMEIGDALFRLGFDVTFVISSNRVFSTMMDVEAAAFFEKKLAGMGVEVLKGDDIVRIDEDGTVHLKSGQKRACEAVIVGKGVNPSISFLAGSGIETNTGIVVDAYQQTNVADIYAAGDVAETFDIVHEDQRINALWPEAEQQGRIAAFNMAFMPAAYQGSLSRNILHAFGISVLSAGMGRADGPEVLKDEHQEYFRKIVLEDGILKGLIFVGEVRNEGLFISLMKRRVDVSALAPSILKGKYSYSKYLKSAMAIRA